MLRATLIQANEPIVKITQLLLPQKIEVGKFDAFMFHATNISSGAGTIYATILNDQGNPGNIILKPAFVGDTEEFTIAPGQKLELKCSPLCSGVGITKYIGFTAPGTYKLRFESGHIRGGINFVVDDQREAIVSVTPPAQPPQPPAPPPPAKPVGKIAGYTLPTSTEIDKKEIWRLVVRNDGGRGVVYAGIRNLQGNPGAVIISHKGNDYNLNPGDLFYISAEIDTEGSVGGEGTITFLAEGNYKIRVEGGHIENGTIITDSFEDFMVMVTKPAAPPTPPPPAPPPPMPPPEAPPAPQPTPPKPAMPMWVMIGIGVVGVITGLALISRRRLRRR